MSIEPENDLRGLESLSALIDGESDAAAAERTCGAWREHAAVRSRWHVYHLIGDVLRAQDLACSPAHDADFLAAFRSRLYSEPTVLAPQPGAAPQARAVHRPWRATSAVAAGFAMVAGALMLTAVPTPPGGPDADVASARNSLVGASAPLSASPAFTAADLIVEPAVVGGNGKLVRDARLERYLTAHQQFAGTSALGVPSGFLRNAAAETPNR